MVVWLENNTSNKKCYQSNQNQNKKKKNSKYERKQNSNKTVK